MATLPLSTALCSNSRVLAPSHSHFNLARFHFHLHASPEWRRVVVLATTAEPGKPDSTQTGKSESAPPKKPVYSLKKKQIVRVDKEKYLNSVNYLSVGHPPYYKGLDYIYEDRGEVLDVRFFETGEYALIAWVGIPTPPAWLPTYMLIKADKLSYERM